MKIMMLSDLYPPFQGGIESHVESLSNQLSKKGHEVFVCTIGRRGLPAYEEKNGVRIYRLKGLFQKIPFLFKDPARKWHPPAGDWLITKRLARIIERERPDIIHAHGWMVYSVIPLKKRFKIPLVYTMHDYRLFCPKMLLVRDDTICAQPSLGDCTSCMCSDYGLPRALAAYYGVRANRNKLRDVDIFLAVSAFVKDAYEKHLRLNGIKIITIPNFYDAESHNEQHKAEFLPDDFMLFVGWLMPHKGVDVLIEAYRKLNTKTKLLLIGIEHPDYHYESTENIRVIKNAPHYVVMEAMVKCRFLVIPSVCAETASTVVREAMSQRKAVVASDIGGLSEAVVDGETGILVPPNNIHKLSEASSYLLENPEVASTMGENGYKRFLENYTADAVIPRIIEVYQSLLLNKGQTV
jgi:glycosyltransferase involved in cell wall biosynthesis